MTLNAVYRFTRSRTALWALLSLAALGLAACSGDELADPVPGDTGPPGPPGPPGGTAAVIGYSKLIKATIAAVNVPEDGRPILDIYLVDENGQKLKGLKAANISFVLARLETPPNGKSTTWRAVTRRLEPFPGSPPPQPPSAVTGTRPTNQAWTESAEAGTWDDSKDDGTYRYTFAKSLKGDAEIPYDGSLAHRVGLEIRLPSRVDSGNIPANNAVYTFSPALNIPVTATREIVDNDTCNACHDNLSFHGGARFDLQYCAMCHESYSFDAQTGNAIDLKVMVHRIHRGEALPTGPYAIFGYNNTYYDFSDTRFSQDTRNCQTCHDESDADTPQASNWRVTVNREACGSCHDDVNFDTGAGHAGVAASADQCATCHGPTSNFGLRADQVHFDPLLRASEKFKYEVVRVVDTRPGQSPTVTIRVTDPTNNNAPYDITAPGGPFQSGSASLRVDVAWSTRPDFTNTGSGSAAATTGTPAQPISIDFKANGVPDPTVPGGFKATAAVAIPADATGSGSALLEGRPNVLIGGTLTAVPVNSAGRTFAITDATPQAYRTVVDINKCNDCHKQVSLHGENRAGNAELCAVCHNPNATDINRRVAGSKCETVTGTLDDQAIDFKVMVHEIHAGPVAGYKVCGYNNEGYDFSYVQYPGKLNNCEGCHLPNTYYPPGSTTGIATTFDAAPAANPSRATPLGDIATSPGAAVCSSCHKSQSARIHMISVQSGGSFDAVKAADSSIPGAPVEVCGNCHGNGSSADVKKVHGVGEFLYN